MPLTCISSARAKNFGRASGARPRAAIASPQVTGPQVGRAKNVKVFEFYILSCAPSRIRTCAHGSGDHVRSRLCARPDLGRRCLRRALAGVSIAVLSRARVRSNPGTVMTAGQDVAVN
jgi:hypothetical protein